MPGQGIVIQITGDGAGAAEAIRVIEERMQQTAAKAAAMQGELAAAGERVGAAFERSVPRVAAASGAIREFEGSLPIRAVERFLTDTLHLGPVLQAAFPLIGAIAFGEMIDHVYDQISKMVDGANHAADSIKNSWGEVNAELSRSSNALDVEIDKTINETNKLLHRSGDNGLRLEFDEARAAADRLAEAIEKDLQKFDELTKKKENHIGLLGSLFTGKAETADAENLLSGVHNDLMKTAETFNEAVERAGESGNKTELQKAQESRLINMQNAYEKASGEITKALQKAQRAQDEFEAGANKAAFAGPAGEFGGTSIASFVTASDQKANINLLTSALGNLAEEQRNIGTQYAQEVAQIGKSSADGVAAAEAAVAKWIQIEERWNSLHSQHMQAIIERDKEVRADKAESDQIEGQKAWDALANQQPDLSAFKGSSSPGVSPDPHMWDPANAEGNSRADHSDQLKVEMAHQAAETIGGFMDQLSSQAMRGRISFKSLVDSAVSDLERFAMKVLEEKALIPLLDSMFGIAAPGALTVNTGNGTAGTSASITAPGYATGGDIAGGNWAIVGDGGDGSGSELFAPKGPGTVLPHDVLEGLARGGGSSRGATPNVTINTINNSSQPVQQTQSGVSWDSDARQFVIHTVLEDMQQGGPMSMALNGFSRS